MLGCNIDDRPEEDYKWWSTQKKYGKKCTTMVRNIERENIDSKLFINTRNNQFFKAKDGKCLLKDSLIVWIPESIIHPCP